MRVSSLISNLPRKVRTPALLPRHRLVARRPTWCTLPLTLVELLRYTVPVIGANCTFKVPMQTLHHLGKSFLEFMETNNTETPRLVFACKFCLFLLLVGSRNGLSKLYSTFPYALCCCPA